jgi:MinD-like ATPase involved in chromosome partitioning or flagellar assembly
MRGDQADGLRRLFGMPDATLAVAAREAAVIDAYALIKRLASEQGGGCFRIAITHARSAEEARALFENMRRVAHEYLGVRLEYAGAAPAPPEEGDREETALPFGVACHDSVL